MLKKVLIWNLFIILVLSKTYQPTWDSLDSRPLPKWFDESKFGIFSHWGVYSVLAIEAWFWYYWKGPNPKPEFVQFMQQHYKPGFSYAEFAPFFTAEWFEPQEFVDIIKSSGAKYFVLTSKHHEGFTLWPSNYSWNWNAMDTGPHRDLVGELRSAFLKLGGVHFGLYFSQYEWFNPLYLSDKAGKFKTNNYVTDVSYPQMLELVNSYQPEVVWSDGDWEAKDTYWKSKKFLAWLYNDSPVKDKVVVNDRWGNGDIGKHGGFMTHADGYDPGHLLARKWECCKTMDKGGWSHRKSMKSRDVCSLNELVTSLARVISCNGNLLLNVGPTAFGTIIPIFQERLRQLGEWLQINAEAVYGSRPWVHQNDSNIWYTSKLRSNTVYDQPFNPQDEKDTIVYAFLLEWPKQGKLVLPSVTPTKKSIVEMVGLKSNVSLRIYASEIGAKIDLSAIDWTSLPSHVAWVIKMQYLASDGFDPIVDLKQKGILDIDGFPVAMLHEADFGRDCNLFLFLFFIYTMYLLWCGE